MNVNPKTIKIGMLSILTVLCIVFSMTPMTALALENDESIISTLVYTEMPRTYTIGSAVTDFTPAALAANTGYDYFWCIDKYDDDTYVGTWWPDSMNSLAHTYSYWDDFTENEIDSWKTAFGTTFDNNYDYTFYGIALLKSDYSFSSTLQFNVTYTDNSTAADSISTDSWDNSFWAEDLSAAPVHTHNGELVKGTAATCTENGVKDYYKCECGTFFEDAACTKEITNLDQWKVVTAAGHKDTDNNRKCDTCGAAIFTAASPQVEVGESSHPFLWFTLLIVFVGGIAAFVIFRKKKK